MSTLAPTSPRRSPRSREPAALARGRRSGRSDPSPSSPKRRCMAPAPSRSHLAARARRMVSSRVPSGLHRRGMAAEIEGLHIKSLETRGDVRSGTARHGAAGSLSRSTRRAAAGRSSSRAERGRSTARRQVSRCSRPTWPGSRLDGCDDGATRREWGPLDVAGDALAAAVADDEAARRHVWRGWLDRVRCRRARVSGGFVTATLEIAGSYGPLVSDPNLKRVAARRSLDEHRSIAVQGAPPQGRAGHASARGAAARRAAAPVRARPRSGRASPRSARELRSPRRPRAPLVRTGARSRLRARAEPRAARRRG